MEGTTVSWESGPEVIQQNVDLAVLMVRVGMATNALAAQLRSVESADKDHGATKMRGVLSSIVTSASLTWEAMKIARDEMVTLRQLAVVAGAPLEELNRVTDLCAGNHPATSILKRARNKLGFHWDAGLIRTSVESFAKSQNLVWRELDAEDNATDRLAADVLGNALLPDAGLEQDQTALQEKVIEALKQISDATNLIFQFFTASVHGYFVSNSVARKTHGDGATSKTLDKEYVGENS
jgi:hypothetical protein